MEITVFNEKIDRSSYKNLCLFMNQDNPVLPQQLSDKSRELIGEIIEQTAFRAKKGKILRIPVHQAEFNNIYLAGLGEEMKMKEDTFRSVSGEFSRVLKSDRLEDVVIMFQPVMDPNFITAVTEGLLLGCYTFDKYRTSMEEEPFYIKKIALAAGQQEDIDKALKIAEAQNFARDLANEPGNVIDPVSLSNKAMDLADSLGLECDIWDEKRIQDENMLALWNVGKGSEVPPRFIHLSYKPEEKPVKKVVIVGKGVTFDSGGLNIKPGEHMRDMKGDKTGACNALGIIKGAADLALPVEVHVVIAAAENMPGGNSYRPDDIIMARNGKTIEIDNTDAEGRVTLADSLSFSCELEPDIIIDLATLTGACVIALGNYTAGLFSNADNVAGHFIEVSNKTGERFWKLPLDDEKLRENIKSKIADVLNTGGRAGGAITAAMFLQEFVKENINWIHLDIAGVDNYKKPFSYYPGGASGYGVRTCLAYLAGFQDQ